MAVGYCIQSGTNVSQQPCIQIQLQHPQLLRRRTKWDNKWSVALRQIRLRRSIFHCDQPWTPGHTCRKLHMYLVEDDDEPPDELEGETNPAPIVGEAAVVTDGTPPEISLHALAGHEVPQLMRVEGQLQARRASTLVATGSTPNFSCEKSARALRCRVENQLGATLKCRGKCAQEILDIEGHKFPVELFTLAIVDLVLGVQFLCSLGEVMWDFVGMRTHFGQTKEGRQTTEAIPRKQITKQKTLKMMKGPATSLMLLMAMLLMAVVKSEEKTKQKLQEQRHICQGHLHALLKEFKVVFELSKGMPPQ
ncbi:uncharacterized protein LOC126410018 [Nymphaea colorata]|uniref:uncharacterized protein LOC126410018 n=1 Tax=Nymphaea colorata TaxID=210225 RepID=UPI00214F1498|nr:uncharacterized protein LOC126410018 [Nymphaea colorata]